MNINWVRMTGRSSILLASVILPVIAIVSSQLAMAQAVLTTNRGWIGLKSGTQSPPGFYFTTLLWFYSFDQLIQLGWHLKNADLVAGYGLYVPNSSRVGPRCRASKR
jgi:hypothetical protein